MTASPSKPPSKAQLAALISLLRLDHAQLHQSARSLLTAFGDHAVPLLLKSAQSEHIATRIRSRAILRDIQVDSLLHCFQNLDLSCIGRDSVRALFVGQELSTQMVSTFAPDSRKLFADLRSHANALRSDCDGKGFADCVELLTDCIHHKIGLRGVVCEPLARDHFVVGKAMECGVGAQITLSLIYVMVARWAGLPAKVVRVPDQFLVLVGEQRPIMVDPLLGGRVTTEGDCARAWGVSSLRELTDREVLVEHLRCLWGMASCRSKSMIAAIAKILGDGEPSTA